MTITSSATPIAPQPISTAREPIAAPPGSGLKEWPASIRGFGHSAASATKEITSTIAAAQPHSHSGIGRLERWTSPCADAVAGSASRLAAISSGTAERRRTLEGGLDRVRARLDAERTLEALRDLAVGADHEQPRLALEVERLQRRAQALVGVVVGVDLLVDE